jgi:hypothetical protein
LLQTGDRCAFLFCSTLLRTRKQVYMSFLFHVVADKGTDVHSLLVPGCCGQGTGVYSLLTVGPVSLLVLSAWSTSWTKPFPAYQLSCAPSLS